jgi:hypothetical protein
MSRHHVGDLVTLQATFTTLDGVNADPTTIAVCVRDPGGTITTYTYAGNEVTKAATGVFRYGLSIIVSGVWVYRWVGTGSVQVASADQTITVEATVLCEGA